MEPRDLFQARSAFTHLRTQSVVSFLLKKELKPEAEVKTQPKWDPPENNMLLCGAFLYFFPPPARWVEAGGEEGGFQLPALL